MSPKATSSRISEGTISAYFRLKTKIKKEESSGEIS
jgi:hypothetical protein